LDNFGHQFGPEPFPPAQINTLMKLLDELTTTYSIPPHRILGHSDIAPLRKKDPGELFPWKELAVKGFGLWPSPYTPASFVPMSVLEIQKALCKIGYSCPQTGIWDEESIAVCTGFQRHFMQDDITGHPTDLTCEVLQGLLGNDHES
jgi:N-acetyl-anhydromuramyl-L-alanine amidase AmpD